MSMHRIIHSLVFTPIHSGQRFTGRWGLPGMFVAGPGTAKSSIIQQVAAAAGMPCETLSPGERGEGAFGAIPVPVDGVITYPLPEWALQFVRIKDGAVDPDGEAGLVFIDEANTGGPHIEPALLGLTLDGRIGGSQLPNRVRRLGAMNEAADAAGGWDLSPALCNRFGWYKWQAPTEVEWSSYWLGNGADALPTMNAEDEEKRVLAAWPNAWAEAVGSVSAFIQRSESDVLNGTPQPGERAFPTRRSVANAMHALASAKVHGLSPDDTSTLVKGFVGEAWWLAYNAFIENMSVPNAADVLDGVTPWKHDPMKLDVTFVLLAKAAALVVGEREKRVQTARGQALWTILADVTAAAKDVGFDAAWALAGAGVCLTHKDAIKVAAKLEDYRKKVDAATTSSKTRRK
jgi:MoxR-like ATPase